MCNEEAYRYIFFAGMLYPICVETIEDVDLLREIAAGRAEEAREAEAKSYRRRASVSTACGNGATGPWPAASRN